MKLSSAYTDYLTNGIFKKLSDNYKSKLSFLQDLSNPTLLDLEYFGNYSGSKETSTVIDTMLISKGEEELTDDMKNVLVDLAYYKYGKNWNNLWKTMTIQYEMLDTYNVTKKETGTDTDKEERDLTTTGKSKNNKSYTDTSENSSQTNNDTQLYGFNSNIPVGADNAQNADSTKGLDEGSSTHESDTTGTDKGSIIKTRIPDLTTTTKGNIFTSPQKLVQEERKVWEYIFYNELYKNLDEIFTCPIYAKYNANS